VPDDLHPQLRQQQLRHRADRHPHRRFPGAGPFEDVARVLPVVLQHAARSAWPGRGLVTGGNLSIDASLLAHQQRQRRADRLPQPHPREHFRLVGLDLHAPAAAVTHLAARQVA